MEWASTHKVECDVALVLVQQFVPLFDIDLHVDDIACTVLLDGYTLLERPQQRALHPHPEQSSAYATLATDTGCDSCFAAYVRAESRQRKRPCSGPAAPGLVDKLGITGSVVRAC